MVRGGGPFGGGGGPFGAGGDLAEGEVAAELPRPSLPVSDQEKPVSHQQAAEVPSASMPVSDEPSQDPQQAAAVP